MGEASRGAKQHSGPVRESLATRRRRRVRRLAITYAAAALTVYVGLWHLSRHPNFAVQSLGIEGNVASSDEAVSAAARAAMASSAFSLLPMTNAYLARGVVVEEAVAEALPEVAEAHVSRVGLDLVLRIEERARFGYWCRAEGGECFALDPDGLIFARETPPEGSTIFGGLVAAADPIRERFAPEEPWENLKVIVEGLRARGIAPARVTSQDGIDFRIELANGPYLLADATHSGVQAMENLEIALDDKTLSSLSAYEYADLRLPHKVFLKAATGEGAESAESLEAEG